MNRRRFLAAGVASLGAACAPAGVRTAEEAGGVALSDVQRLIVERADPIAGRCRYVADLGARQVAQPILVARRGERFDGVIENRLPQPTTVHFHGLTLPEAEDGAGFAPIPPGKSRRVQFQVRNRSGLYWFHPHPHGFTAEQVQAGLAGLLVVKDEEDEALDAALGLTPENRLALAIADVRMAAGEIRPYAPDAHDCLHGWLGNRALSNGRLDARWDVAPGWVRLQILNACNARGLLLAFRDGETLMPFHLLGTDGGLLAAPQALERVFLYGGERVDVAIQTGTRPLLEAVSLEFDPRHHAHGEAASHAHPARASYAPLAAASICGATQGGVDALPDGAPLPLFSSRVAGSAPRSTPLVPGRLSALADVAGGEA
ncbi:MAG: multicopper oxidase domain-containing protein, partial [Betaproteobacteria bacterium]|nr:multicopper oxidase domain-containing protein [Betaproteobacteria bacterium]